MCCEWLSSNPSGMGWPDFFVQLDLQTNGQAIVQDPFGKMFGMDEPKRGGHQKGEPSRQATFPDDFAGPLIIGAAGNDKLQFVPVFEMAKVFVEV